MWPPEGPALPSRCPAHPEALLMERTLLGRMGCLPCRTDPWNLDPLPELEPIDVDGGETRCPGCKAAVWVQPTRYGARVVNPDHSRHEHQRGAPATQEPAAPPPVARPIWEVFRE